MRVRAAHFSGGGLNRKFSERFGELVDQFDFAARPAPAPRRGMQRDQCGDADIVAAADAMQHHMPAVDRKLGAALVQRIVAAA